MITFSFSKIVEFLEKKGWVNQPTLSENRFLAPKNLYDLRYFFIHLPKINTKMYDEVYVDNFTFAVNTISLLYKIPFYELALIHFADTPTVLTLAEYVSQFSYGVNDYAKFLGQPINISQMSELFEGFDWEDRLLYMVNFSDDVEVLFESNHCEFLHNEKTMELPLPKTFENFVMDFLRIVGEQKRLKFKQK